MAMILNKKEEEDELSKQIRADLREKSEETSNSTKKSTAKTPDFAEDSEYLKDFKETGRFSWIWIVIFVILIIVGLVVAFNL